jgi:hypothetical protein
LVQLPIWLNQNCRFPSNPAPASKYVAFHGSCFGSLPHNWRTGHFFRCLKKSNGLKPQVPH